MKIRTNTEERNPEHKWTAHLQLLHQGQHLHREIA